MAEFLTGLIAEFSALSGYDLIFTILVMINGAFSGLIVIEAIWHISRKQRSWRETAANFMIMIGNQILDRTPFALIFVGGLYLVSTLISWQIPLTWWSWCLALLLADFTYYWMHRFEHEIRLLWGYHAVHHSSPEYNLSTSLRLAWVESLFEWLFFLPMVLMGFEIEQILAAALTVIIYQTWIHTEMIGKLGWLDIIFNTPSVHRVHHGSNPLYIDKNYAGILLLWDHLFGTYQAETEKVVYGITDPIESHNPIWINFAEFAKLWQDLRQATQLSHIFGYLFYHPGWQPPLKTTRGKK